MDLITFSRVYLARYGSRQDRESYKVKAQITSTAGGVGRGSRELQKPLKNCGENLQQVIIYERPNLENDPFQVGHCMCARAWLYPMLC